MKMGNLNSGKRIYSIRKDFFKVWSSNMAYIFGFTCADGNVYKKTLSWDLSNKSESNLELLNNFNKVLESNYPIKFKCFSHRLDIFNSVILEDIKKLGIVPNKKKVLLFPDVPERYIKDFIRGFLDGDGWITTRKRNEKYNEICVGFSNGSYNFMKGLIDVFQSRLGILQFNLRCREKKTKFGNISKTYQLEFYADNANKILLFLYRGLSKDDLFLTRKYKKYLEAQAFFDETKKIKKFGRKWIYTESSLGEIMENLLKKYVIVNKMLPKEVANEFRISLSTLYRWLDKSGVRTLEKRGSKEWSKRITFSKGLIKNVK